MSSIALISIKIHEKPILICRVILRVNEIFNNEHLKPMGIEQEQRE